MSKMNNDAKRGAISIIFFILSITWGIVMSLPGAVLATVYLAKGATFFSYGNCFFFEHKAGWGNFSLGAFCFVEKGASERTLKHEHGHAVQNCIYGPLMIPLVSLPSMIRYHYREYQRKKGNVNLPPYDSVWFEGQATKWGTVYVSAITNK